jgi:hypothetical protein
MAHEGTGIMQGSPPRPIPPREDWDRAPWNRWTFHHVREMVPTAEVWRGTGAAYPFAEGKPLPGDLAVQSVAGAASTLDALLDETFTDGFMVLKDGAIVCERYFGTMTHRDRKSTRLNSSHNPASRMPSSA